MRKLYALSLLFLTGCMTHQPDGTKTHNLLSRINPVHWFNTTGHGEIVAASPFIPYHYGSIAMFISGVICIAWAKGNSKTGLSLIIGSAALSAWATFIPRVSVFVTWLLIAGAVAGMGYLAWKLLKK